MKRRLLGFALLTSFAACGMPATFSPAPGLARPTPAPLVAPAAPGDRLAFAIDVGGVDNRFFRRGSVAAHVLLAAGRIPRFIVAFPAGDAGAALWFDDLPEGVHLDLDGALVEAARPGGLRGVTATLHVRTRALHVREAVLGGVRAIRERAAGHPLPPGFAVQADLGPPLLLRRTMLDGRSVRLELSAEGGATFHADGGGRLSVLAGPGEEALTLHATALTDEDPLTPIPRGALLDGASVADPQSRDALAFLSAREKLLAGSWRFLNYFGRDTLLSLQMLMPVLGAEPIEAGLGAVLDRLAPDGDVAHEEIVGEWAVVEGRALDYTMIDDDFLLAPALCRYLLDTSPGRARGRDFLARRTPAGVTYREAARRNLARVLARAAPFARTRDRASLVALAPTALVGNWRDSDDGLGGGRYPYDVNVALVPAALEAAARLHDSPLVDPDPEAAARARALLEAWRDVGSLFRVEIPADEARARVARYAEGLGMDPAAAVAALGEPVVFDALALDAGGAPVPVLHTDVASRWMFDAPPSEEIVRQARALAAPFPAGLLTPVGVVVANPALSGDPALERRFTPHDYHGTVVWSWQQALIAAGIDRQLARSDLSPAARRALRETEGALWKVIRATQAVGMGTAELWSFAVKGGVPRLVPFGEGRGDADESNAAQLWSTVYLAVRPSWER